VWSAALYDAVATMDTVTLLRSAIRGLLAVAGPALGAEIRAVLARDDDYATAGKPSCDWADPAAREALIEALSTDALDALIAMEGRSLAPDVAEAVELLAAVAGQDLEESDGSFRIARGVAPDRVISTVDPDARHGHKTAARGFDGYKAHVCIDPDSEIITATVVSAANAGDAAVATELVSELLGARAQDGSDPDPAEEPVRVYGDAAYGTGSFLAHLESAGISPMVKVQPPHAPDGHLPKDRFSVDLELGTVSCPAGATVPIRPLRDGSGVARFGKACATCPLRSSFTSSPKGRIITVGANETELTRARERQLDPGWLADYRATRPKVERKFALLTRRGHGGRKARVRGQPKVARDLSLRSAAMNLARLAVLGLSSRSAGGWAVATT
jgi:Transposase DDE domain